MKIKILKQFVFLLALSAFVLSGCDDEVNKRDYEISDPAMLPALTISLGDVTYESAAVSVDVQLNGDSEFIEKGFIVSQDELFNSAESILSLQLAEDFNALVEVLGSTQYFIRAYTLSENGLAYSESVSFTTPEAPKFEDTYLYGTYTEVDYLTDGSIEATYEGGIIFSEKVGSANQFYIENFWDGGEKIVASVDFESKTISIEPQAIYIYGADKYMMYSSYEENGAWTYNTTSPVLATYDDQGNIHWGPWNVVGYYFYLKSELVKVN